MDAKTRVLASWKPTPTTHAIRVARPEGYRFRAGQHVMLQLEASDGEDDRFLSIASSPARDHLEFAVRLSESAFKQAFANLAPHDEVTVSRPAGRFVLDDGAPAVLVSGGIGITPIKSMIEHATDERLALPFVLLYANRSPDEIVFHDELDSLARANPNLHVAHTVDDASNAPHWKGRTGRIDLDMLRRETSGLKEPVYYTCGPPGMVAAMTRLLQDAGTDADRVRAENFTGY